jgi:hypothetical protein
MSSSNDLIKSAIVAIKIKITQLVRDNPGSYPDTFSLIIRNYFSVTVRGLFRLGIRIFFLYDLI